MLTEYEARQLRHDMQEEFSAEPSVALTFAVILLSITGLAWLGANDDLTGRASASSATPRAEQRERYSKTVFDQRRERYIEAHPESLVAREATARKQKDAHADGSYFAYQPE